MHKIERRQKILSKIKSYKFITTKELNAYFLAQGISTITLRRDLLELAKEGYLKLSFGAVNYIATSIYEETRNEKKLKNITSKTKIAQKAQTFLQADDIIFVSSGTTMEYFVEKITVPIKLLVTNGLDVFNNAIKNKNLAELVLIGGNFRTRSHSFVGQSSLQQIHNFNFTKCFLTATNINNQFTIFNNNEFESQILAKVLEQSNESYLLLDKTKFNSIGISKVTTLDKINYLITDYHNEIKSNEDFPFTKLIIVK